jgi:hypothetical protein
VAAKVPKPRWLLASAAQEGAAQVQAQPQVLVRLDRVLRVVTVLQLHQRAAAVVAVRVQQVPLVILAALPAVLVCLHLLQEPL